MSKLSKVLKLGNEKLYETSILVVQKDLEEIKEITKDLHDILFEFRAKYVAGRAIAAPQIGYMKRFIYMNIDKPIVFINPELINKSEEMIEVWDDCLCFPELLVKVKRHKSCTVKYLDESWKEKTIFFSDHLSELIQHEYDHLDGILATQRAIDDKSFRFR